MHSYKMIVIRHDATVNMLWKKFAFENLKVNSETKSLSQNAVQNVETNGEKQKCPVSHCGTFLRTHQRQT